MKSKKISESDHQEKEKRALRNFNFTNFLQSSERSVLNCRPKRRLMLYFQIFLVPPSLNPAGKRNFLH